MTTVYINNKRESIGRLKSIELAILSLAIAMGDVSASIKNITGKTGYGNGLIRTHDVGDQG